MIVRAAVRLVAGCATLSESRLVMIRLFGQVGDVAVAAETDVDGGGFRQAGLLAGMRTVAVGAIAGGSGMLDFGGFDELGFVVVAGDTEGFDVLLREDDFAVLSRGVADVTLLVGEGRMRELGHQLGRGGLMGIVTGEAISFFKRLVLVSLLQVGALGVMAIDAESGRGLGQMKIEFLLADLAGLVGHVAGFAAHIESGVAAAFLGNVQAGVMATEAEIFFLLAGSGLQQLVLIVGNMRVVTLQAVPLRRRMNRALEVGGILVDRK